MNETHEKVAYLGAVLGLIEQTILSMQNGFLQCPLNKVVIQRGAGLAEEKREPFPMFYPGNWTPPPQSVAASARYSFR